MINDIDILAKIWNLDNTKTTIIDPKKNILAQSGITNIMDCLGEYDGIQTSNSTLLVIVCDKHAHVSPQVPQILFNKMKDKDSNDESFYLIKNRDRSIRWLAPISLTAPHFLTFYNSPTFKSKIYKKLFKAIYAVKLQRFFFDAVTIRCNTKLKSYIPDSILYDSFTLFTGTVGENRKAIVALNYQGRSVHFIKIALTHSSAINLENEKYFLKLLAMNKTETFEHPTIIDSVRDDSLVISNIAPLKIRNSFLFGEKHVKVLYELGKTYSRSQRLGDIVVFKELIANIGILENGKFLDNGLDHNVVYGSIVMIKDIVSVINLDAVLTTTISHGDFTPWNMFIGEKKLHIYDWELAREEIPFLFDFFHYIYQSNILVGDNNIETIVRAIDEALRSPEMIALIDEFNVNTDLVHALYLCHTATYYLSLYTKQKLLHQQAHWLVTTWGLALSRINIILEGENGTSAC